MLRQLASVALVIACAGGCRSARPVAYAGAAALTVAGAAMVVNARGMDCENGLECTVEAPGRTAAMGFGAGLVVAGIATLIALVATTPEVSPPPVAVETSIAPAAGDPVLRRLTIQAAR